MEGDKLDQFVAEIVTAKNLSGVTEEVRTQLISDLKQRLIEQINRALIDAMPDTKVDELNSLLDDPTTDQTRVQQFIANSGIDVNGVTLDTMLRFRELYIRPQSQKA